MTNPGRVSVPDMFADRDHPEDVPDVGLQPQHVWLFLPLLRRGGSLAASSDDLPTRD